MICIMCMQLAKPAYSSIFNLRGKDVPWMYVSNVDFILNLGCKLETFRRNRNYAAVIFVFGNSFNRNTELFTPVFIRYAVFEGFVTK